MMITNHSKISYRSGFTLVELLVYVSISALIISALSSLAVVVLRTQSSQEHLALVTDEVNFITLHLDKILKDIALIEMPAEGETANQLVATDSNDDEVEVLLEDGSLLVNINGLTIYQSQESVVIQDLAVISYPNELVAIEFLISGNDPSSSDSDSVDYVYQVTRRNN